MSDEFVISGRPPLTGYKTDVIPPAYAQQIDTPDSSTTYIGLAKSGTLTSAALWQIQKVIVSGTVTSFTWADGDSSFDNIWDNRSSLTYN